MEHSYDTPLSPDVPEEGAAATKSEWAARITRVIARQIRFWREERGLSAQQLADKTKDLGYQVPRSVIANLENDRRDAVTIAEIFVLAAALDIPPTLLVTAVGHEATVEVLPELHTSTWQARGWILGARHPNYYDFSLANWENARRAIALYDVHRVLINEYIQVQNRLRNLLTDSSVRNAFVHTMASTSGDKRDLTIYNIRELVASLVRVREHRKLIAAEGYLLPELPPLLAVMLPEDVSSSGPRAQVQADTRLEEQIAGAILSNLIGDTDPNTPQ